MNSPSQSIWLGYDSKETTAFAVAKYSIRKFQKYIPVKGLVLSDLKSRGLYYRPTKKRTNSDGKTQLWDEISDAPMSTEFSNSRFLVPHLAKQGWALFADSDIIVQDNISKLFERARNDKAVMCVKHDYDPSTDFKMDGQIQTKYSRKNWSSVMLFNCDHPSNGKLTVEMVNTVPGRDLHGFCWLSDDEIGDLPPQWNYLVGYSKLSNGVRPSLIHFTDGLPDVAGYEDQEYADHWRSLRPYAVGAL
jgi:lipopolysaccharide biosynthesis glycosyltransferase